MAMYKKKEYKKSHFLILALFLSLSVVSSISLAADTAVVTATVTIQNISVSVNDGTVNYGIIPVNSWRSTLAGEANDMQTATNDGNVPETFNIRGQNSAAWTLASSQGPNQYVHQFCNNTANNCSTPPTNYLALTTNYQTLATNISPSGTIDFHLRIGTPASTSSYAQQNVDVTVQAVAY